MFKAIVYRKVIFALEDTRLRMAIFTGDLWVNDHLE